MQPISKAWNYVKQNKWKALGVTAAACTTLVWWRSRNVQSDWQQQQQRKVYWTESQIPQLLEQLRKTDLDRQAKLELWEQLKVASFAYSVSAVYGMTLMAAYLRVTVNVLSRYLFTAKQSTSPSISSLIMSLVFKSSNRDDQAAVRELCSLPGDIQRQYIALTDHFLKKGLPRLVDTILELAKPDLDHWSLKKECTYEDTKLMVTTIHARVQKLLRSVVSSDDDLDLSLRQLLLPPDPERFTPGTSDPAAAQAACLKATIAEEELFDGDISESDKLKLLINETRNIVESTPFDLVVDSCLRTSMGVCFEELSKIFSEAGDKTASQKILLAKLIPLLNKQTGLLLSAPDNVLVTALSHCRDLNDFSQRVFDDRVFEHVRISM